MWGYIHLVRRRLKGGVGDVEAEQEEDPIKFDRNLLSNDFVPGTWDLC